MKKILWPSIFFTSFFFVFFSDLYAEQKNLNTRPIFSFHSALYEKGVSHLCISAFLATSPEDFSKGVSLITSLKADEKKFLEWKKQSFPLFFPQHEKIDLKSCSNRPFFGVCGPLGKNIPLDLFKEVKVYFYYYQYNLDKKNKKNFKQGCEKSGLTYAEEDGQLKNP